MGKSVQEGNIYSNVKVLEFSHINNHGKKVYSCECLLCNSNFETLGTLVKNGRTKSCGCLQKNITGDRFKTHGMSNERVYKIWKGIKSRCRHKSYHAYNRYGGRGIKVCDEWENDFMKFYTDMKDTYFDGAELDRIDNDGDYCAENCRWITHKENSNNRTKYFNKSGYTGIHYRETKNRYEANVCINRIPKHIGVYHSLEEAVNGRKDFIIDYNSKNNTNYKYEEYKG